MRLLSTNGGDHRGKDAGFYAGQLLFAEQAGNALITRAVIKRIHHQQLTFKTNGRTANQRPLLCVTDGINLLSTGWIIGAVQHQVVLAYGLSQCLIVKPCVNRIDTAVGVEFV